MARINFATPSGQIEWQKAIEKEQKTRATWMSQYGSEEYKLAPRMVKVKRMAPQPASLASAAPSVEPGDAPTEEAPLTHEEVLKRMQFSTTTSDDFWDMASTRVHNLAKTSIQHGQFNRRKSLHSL
ncbi:hypothetical protein KFE25_007001 [Diacronema lutheri]|nr:hypothetical protein KFE25_007001 [Diacronema lutheri]